MSPDTAVQPRIRILHCHDCRTLDEIPWFEGPPQYDTLLEMVLSKHETNGHRHIGKLFDVEERVWVMPNLRAQIIENIKGGSKGLAAFDPEFYNTRDTFQEDALKCFQLHLRPAGACPDWKSDRKKLVPGTKADRKEIGLDMSTAPVQYLCRFCPVSVFYEKKERGD
jgi:hypothetical protein